MSTPLAVHFSLSARQCPSTDEGIEEMPKKSYANVVGCSMYAMVCTIPDIAQAVDVVSKYMANQGKEYWNEVKWILKYLNGAKDLGMLSEGKQGSESVVGYVDSDFARDLDKRRSTIGSDYNS